MFLRAHFVPLIALLSASFAATAGAQTVWYVDDDASPPYLGTLTQPFLEIQDAIAHPAVVAGDTVQVGAGSYGQVDFLGKAIRVASTHGAGATCIGGSPFESAVRFVSGEGSATVLDGFTLTSGGTHEPPNWFGGGIYCLGSTPTVRNCWLAYSVLDASLSYGGNCYGGGLYTTSPILLEDCVIMNNSLRGWDEGHVAGAGVYGPAILRRCTIENNEALGDPLPAAVPAYGGGAAHALLEDCIVRGNRVKGANSTGIDDLFSWAEGGGAYECALLRCTIEDNTVVAETRNDLFATELGFGGGASRSQLTDCTVRGNRVVIETYAAHGPAMGGAGIAYSTALDCELLDNVVDSSYSGGSSKGGGAFSSTLERCVLAANIADWGGGAAHAAAIRSSTFSRNAARLDGGALFECASANSSILWGNQPDEVAWIQSPPALAYCDVDQVALATGTNFRVEPLLWHPAVDDVHLRPGSPCIDAGDPSLPLDPDGSPADVGALAYDAQHCSTPLAYCTAKVNSLGCAPTIGALGIPRMSAPSPAWITCSQVLSQQPGTLFYGLAGRSSAPFQGGTLCVQPPTRRTPPQLSGGHPAGGDCSGIYALDFNAWILGGADPALQHGVQVNAQYWSRDPSTATGTGLSDALEFVLCM